MFTQACDHTSVGMLIWNQNRLLLIERKNFPFGFAPPAGHVDGDTSYEDAASRELTEEVGIHGVQLSLVLEVDRNNTCRRTDGIWHHWKVYEAHTANKAIRRSKDETNQAGWFTRNQIQELAERTRRYEDGQITDAEWQRSPGLEKVWHEHFNDLGIL